MRSGGWPVFPYRYIDVRTPMTLNTRVRPDPLDAQRLEDKFQHARNQLNHFLQRGCVRVASSPPDWIAFGSAARWPTEV
jgi:hypothetical protein